MCSPQSKAKSLKKGLNRPGSAQLSKALRSQFSQGVGAVDGNHVKRQGDWPSDDSCCKKTARPVSAFDVCAHRCWPSAPPHCAHVSVTNFDEYYCIAVKHDQIQLAALA
jgi:hypothetical protein